MTLHATKTAICDIAGFYDEFTIAQVLEWVGNAQCTRDAVRQLCREGVLIRIRRGIYRWTY